ncbi:mucosa-associated lymphoid tissue lymphoma translocation protein 1 isoform X2 [Nomia melanderi]|uniref:mucosa-associated lymphoid tissue lymphoma translocation protein 1 isoform X2 n=1 Tax=Nomia melanderi TaxID=2448451 RepID=UPI0013042D58|nr:mucosa-associated lymphoid tissue lymphoma translocation protein 1-like isoform X2 [Nomia melanderi]
MSQIDANAYIECLPANVYKDLVNALNKDEAWITLANYVAEHLQYQCTSWIQSLKEIKELCNSPGERLLFELNVKMCTVEILRMLLHDCGLHNALSIISHPEPLQIIMHPTEQLQSDTLKISFGQNLQLFCKAIGMPPPSYMWYHGNMALQHCDSGKLDIVITSISQIGEYKCKVSQIKHDGTVISSLISKTVNVHIFPTPVIIEEQPQPILEVKEGENFTIHCKASGNPEPQYQWFHDNTKLEGETSNILHIKKFNSKHEGKYYCHVYNDVGEIYTQRTHIMMYLPKLKAVAKTALIIANGDYDNHECLLTPKNDGAYIAKLLKEIGFKVICLMNLTIKQIRNAIELFSKALVEGVYGLFYFAGHGFKMQESYILATDTPTVYLRKDAICESELLASFLQNDPELLIIILDMCQTLPSKNFNSVIYNELPVVIEYKSKKNLRNLIQAYSTSSYRPSYEKLNSQYGLYITHLCKYITKDIQVTKLFEEVGKGKERNQIPMFASSITKPFRLTDAIYKRNLPAAICYFNELTSFPTVTFDISFKQANIHGKVTIWNMEPYLNIIKIKLSNLEHLKINFYNLVPAKKNNLYQDQNTNECWIHNPQINEGPIVISVFEHGRPIGATLLNIRNYVSPLLKLINF